MLSILFKSIKSKKFYTAEYKKMTRKKVIGYVFVLIVMASVFITPIVSYKYFSAYKSLKEQILNVPSKLLVSYSENKGLTTNTDYPVVIEISKNTFLVLDTKANYTRSTEKTATEIVLKNRGYVIYDNGEIVDQQKYNLGQQANFTLSFKEVKKYFNYITDTNLFIYMIGIMGLIIFFNLTISVMFISFSFGVIIYTAQKNSGTKVTFNQCVKKIMLLMPYFILGFTINEVLNKPLPGLGVMLLLVGYLYTSKTNKTS